ncbi:MAG: P-loop NTPase [Microthrixaceae bacterium]
MRRHWIVVFLAFSVVIALGMATALLPPDRFRANAVVLVQPDPTKPQFQAQVVSFLVPSIIAQAESRTFRDLAKRDLPERVRSARVKVTIVDAGGTGVLTVTASSTRRDAVAPWATAYATELARSTTGAGFVTLSLLDTARTPSAAYAPQRKAAVASTLVLGVIAAVLTAIAAAAFRRRGDELDEVRLRFGATVLGEMPIMRDRRRHGMDVIFGANAPPEVTEALQSLRTNLELLMHDRHPRTIAIVSASSGEGKSTIAAALAWSLASVGEHVTAVDADLRRPMLHHYLHGRLALGVASADEVPMDRLLQRTSVSSLRLLSAGVPKRHPAEVLRTNLPQVLAGLGHDTVVIDCPPMEGFAETGSITTLAHSVIVVVDRRRRDFVDVERTLAALHDRGADVLGIVINRSSRKSAAGKYYYPVPAAPEAPLDEWVYPESSSDAARAAGRQNRQRAAAVGVTADPNPRAPPVAGPPLPAAAAPPPQAGAPDRS